QKHHISIYPSPAQDFFQIDLGEGGYHKLVIYNLRGRVVYSQQISPNRTEMAVQTNLSSGLYFIKLNQPEISSITRLLICK
ncbi:T9SS type A sorting domain-containing protein, partial [candidate division KSB1 bacterium]|nr:T9SS type A sorting domain-containing protein [candidate division KSB1 bacterium]